jgi:hypothetical protein
MPVATNSPITGDARVVGGGYLQLETWVLFDAHHGEHWVTFGFGSLGPLELTAGFVWGVAFAAERQGAIHINIGLSVQNRGPTHPQFVSGLGFQARLLGPFALVAEIVVGNVLDPEIEGGSVQAGYRLLLSDDLQLDGTFGADLWGEGRGWWVTGGIRVVAPRFDDPEASLPGHALQ